MLKLTRAGLVIAISGGLLAVCRPMADSYTLIKLVFLSAGGLLAWIGLAGVPLRATALDRPLAALWAVMLVSTAFSVDPALSVLGVYPQPFHGLLPLGLCTALYYAAAMSPEDHGEELLAAALVASIPLALFGVWQRFFGDPITRQALPTGMRITSTIGNPVMLGACLVLIFPAALHRTLTRKSYLWPLCGALLIIALWMTVARGAWLSAAASVGAYLWLTGRVRPKTRHWLALVLCAPLVFWGTQRALNKKDSDSLRAETTKSGLAAFAARPLLGWGPDTFLIAFRRYKTEEFLRVSHNSPTVQLSAHNDFLQAAVTLGVVGLLAYLWLIWTLGASLISASRSEGPAAAIAAGLAGLFVQAKFNPIPISALALAAIMMGLVCRGRGRAPIKPAASRIAAGLAVVFCAGCAILFVRFCRADFLNRRGHEIVFTAILGEPEYMDGVNALRRSTELNPWSIEYLMERCSNLFRVVPFIPPEQARELLAKARQITAEGVRLHPENPMAHELRATALALSSRHGEDTLREAQKEIQLASEMDPSFVFSLRRRMDIARALGDREDFERAKKQYIRVSEISHERAEWTPLL
ncbi:MAG: O-antigen ligase family protein [Elusimicrobia bacterium]|nr:O-antigen ligase family protein [Elusimicrobiota bacterium]